MAEPLNDEELDHVRTVGEDAYARSSGVAYQVIRRLIATIDAERERSEARATLAIDLANDLQRFQEVYVKLSERLLAAEKICRAVWDTVDGMDPALLALRDDWIAKGGY